MLFLVRRLYPGRCVIREGIDRVVSDLVVCIASRKQSGRGAEGRQSVKGQFPERWGRRVEGPRSLRGRQR